MRCFLLNRLIKIIVLPFLSILNLNAQDELNIQNEEFMPLHTRILWGEKGLIRKMNLAPETRRAELKLRTKMLQNHQKLAMVSLGLLAYQYSLGQQVIDSGFGYTHGANLTLRHTGNSNIVVSGTANVTTTGLGPGYWASDESEMNAKYIHDNDFYQSHSYVVETGLSLDKYRDILLKSAHIAGTKLFGKVIRESSVNNAVTVSNSSIGAV